MIEWIADDSDSTWWQSANGQNDAFIQLDLEGEFTFTYIYIKFKSIKPGAFFIEKSDDYARTWRPMVFYSTDCASDFPHVEPRDHHYELEQPYCRTYHIQLGNIDITFGSIIQF